MLGYKRVKKRPFMAQLRKATLRATVGDDSIYIDIYFKVAEDISELNKFLAQIDVMEMFVDDAVPFSPDDPLSVATLEQLKTAWKSNHVNFFVSKSAVASTPNTGYNLGSFTVDIFNISVTANYNVNDEYRPDGGYIIFSTTQSI